MVRARIRARVEARLELVKIKYYEVSLSVEDGVGGRAIIKARVRVKR